MPQSLRDYMLTSADIIVDELKLLQPDIAKVTRHIDFLHDNHKELVKELRAKEKQRESI